MLIFFLVVNEFILASAKNIFRSLPDGDTIVGERKARNAGGQHAVEVLCKFYSEAAARSAAEWSLRRSTNGSY